MTDMEMIESLNNAWKALSKQYEKERSEGIRCGMNLLAKVISKVKAEIKESHKEGQVTLEEWMDMLQEK